MEVSDGTRERAIRDGAKDLMEKWTNEITTLLEKEADAVNGTAIPIYMTASYSMYLKLKKLVENLGGSTWMEEPPE